MLDTVQQIKQSMFWTVSLTFDLIHFVGRCPPNIHVLDIILVSSKLNVSGSAKHTCVEMMYHLVSARKLDIRNLASVQYMCRTLSSKYSCIGLINHEMD